MELALALLVALGKNDAKFCPSAPSPISFQATVSLSQGASGKFDDPNSAQVASKLVNSKTGKLVGWLYLDEHGTPYVSLVPHIDRATYVWFRMPQNNMHKPEYATEAIIQPNLRLPKGLEVQSCTQSYN